MFNNNQEITKDERYFLDHQELKYVGEETHTHLCNTFSQETVIFRGKWSAVIMGMLSLLRSLNETKYVHTSEESPEVALQCAFNMKKKYGDGHGSTCDTQKGLLVAQTIMADLECQNTWGPLSKAFSRMYPQDDILIQALRRRVTRSQDIERKLEAKRNLSKSCVRGHDMKKPQIS